MITNIPSVEDFESNGLAFLNLAWESIITLSSSLAWSSEYLVEHDEITPEEQIELEQQYWQHAQTALAVAVALTHQGAEFLLKGRISAVSPFLLIAGEPSKWPKGVDRKDTSFADLKTIDAQDLVRLYDSVCTDKLSADFKRRFEELRRLRNTVMHSVDRRTPFTVRDGLLAILHISEALMGPKSWQKMRIKYNNSKIDYSDPGGYSEFNPAYPFARETLHVLDDVLKPAEVKRFYEFDKKKTRYLCFGCYEPNAEEPVYSCLLREGDSQNSTVFCVCCDTTFTVVLQRCQSKACKGNVFLVDDLDESDVTLRCLKCGLYTSEH